MTNIEVFPLDWKTEEYDLTCNSFFIHVGRQPTNFKTILKKITLRRRLNSIFDSVFFSYIKNYISIIHFVSYFLRTLLSLKYIPPESYSICIFLNHFKYIIVFFYKRYTVLTFKYFVIVFIKESYF